MFVETEKKSKFVLIQQGMFIFIYRKYLFNRYAIDDREVSKHFIHDKYFTYKKKTSIYLMRI